MVSKQVKVLIATSKALIDKLTFFETHLNSLDAEQLKDNELVEYELRLNDFKNLDQAYGDVAIQLDAEGVDSGDFRSYRDFNIRFMRVYSQATILYNKATNFSRNNSNVASHSSNHMASAKLPKIQIPTFDGNLCDFTAFHETFVSLVHNNNNLSNIEKFHYLAGSLAGKAKRLISNITPSGDNYKIAFDLLCERFNNPKLLIQGHVKNIFDLKPLTKENASDLRVLHDEIIKNVRALQNLKINIEDSVVFLSHILMNKFDPNTRQKFSELKPNAIPTFKEIDDFLKQRCLLLEEIETNKPSAGQASNPKTPNNLQGPSRYKPHIKQSFVATNTKIPLCVLCHENHFLNHCKKFQDLTVKERSEKVSDLRSCRNCLRHSDNLTCRSKVTCAKCQKRHNTLLHFERENSISSSPANTVSRVDENSIQGTNSTDLNQASLSCIQSNIQVLLATAILKVKGRHGWFNVRCLLDSGSQQSFITESLFNKLQLTRKPSESVIIGINNSFSRVNGTVTIQIGSLYSKFQAKLPCSIILKITETLPTISIDKSTIKIPTNISLADDSFNKPGPIDMLIGASLFYDLLLEGCISLGKGKPILKETTLGWIISGNLPISNNVIKQSAMQTYFSVGEPLSISSKHVDTLLSKFWQLEEVTPKNSLSLLSPTERFCETYFNESVKRNDSGRLIVSIPFNSNLFRLGSSKTRAINRFLSLERKLIKDSLLKQEYTNFIHEYEGLGHMTKLPIASDVSSFFPNCDIKTVDAKGNSSQVPPYYLPHHAIIKSSSLTTKLRVVFDASAKSDSGVSLNDSQVVGPVIQDDLFAILLRFRKHQIALVGDIEKAYRQILIEPALRKFHLILWRDDPSYPIDTYCLNTVTYGTASASYLTTRCLKYLADLNHKKFPQTSNIVRTCFYMDDLLTGGDTVEDVSNIKNQLIELLGEAGFTIRKFLSNNNELLSLSDNTTSFFTVPVGERESTKTLGVIWNSVSDQFQYNYCPNNSSEQITKRIILSTTSQIFDPLGVLQPVIIKGKIIIQKLWQLKLDWDDIIPTDLKDEWSELFSSFCYLNSFKIPRCIISSNSTSLELIGFSDASHVAYGACVYLRSTSLTEHVSTILICSKSRVAPLHGVTIPRLELCAALLLAELMEKVKNSLDITFNQVFYFTDSTTVLHWINAVPHKYKIFVANRIARIQELSIPKDWLYVKSKDNPADLVSRGISSQALVNNQLWFHGPSFLYESPSSWSKSDNFIVSPTEMELKNTVQVNVCLLTYFSSDIFSKFSKLTRCQRVVAWMLRFSSNSHTREILMRRTCPLSVTELQEALMRLIKLCQSCSFSTELQALHRGQEIKSSHIKSLNPFLDDRDIIRVGGRLCRSTFAYKKKFPILLPKGHVLTKLILKHFHEKLLHCGPQQLLAHVREEYWPIAGRNASKEIYHKCVTCFRAQPHSYNPFMSDLPLQRLQCYTSVFTNVGVDYAGPILIKDRKLRGAKLLKSYICLFVCMVTRAIHLELVTELTINSFIAALRRFIGRRGKPSCIMSDNATNFVGAARELRELYSFLQSSVAQKDISNFLTEQGIVWKFIIPHSPHMGGMWERSIRSTKTHLRKVLGNTQTTYEDFQTILIQVEAVLNSRPLSPLSTNPLDLTPLTCGHFLIGRPLTALPEPNVEVNENRMRHYERIQKITNDFWKRWSIEVVPELQRRTKWFSRLPELVKVGAIVLIKNETVPPLQWRLGRVIKVHRSSDGIIRSATLKLSNQNELKRAVHSICVLPEV